MGVADNGVNCKNNGRCAAQPGPGNKRLLLSGVETGVKIETTAIGREIKVINSAIAIAGNSICGICDGNDNRPMMKNSAICIIHVKPSKKVRQLDLVPYFAVT